MAVDPDAIALFQPQIDALKERPAPTAFEARLAALEAYLPELQAWQAIEAAGYRAVDGITDPAERAARLNELAERLS